VTRHFEVGETREGARQPRRQPAYYLASQAFWIKMVLFAVFALEILPMATLIQWRIRARRGELLDFGRAPLFATISRVQAALLVLIVLAATAMARGVGL
jgi:putative membrane protein